MKEKLKPFLVGAAIVGLLAMAWAWHSSSTADAELAKLRAENEQKFAAIAEQLQTMAEDNKARAQENAALRSANSQLASANARLAGEVNRVREERDRRLAEIPSLTPDKVTEQTIAALELKPPEIRLTADGLVIFTQDAAKVNLEHLVIGEKAQEELSLANHRIANLETQLQNDEKVIENQKQIIANKDSEISAVTERADLREGELKKELEIVKKKARTGKMIAFVAGLVTGLILGRF